MILKNLFVFFLNIAHCDAPEAWQLGIQDPATPTLEGMMSLHDYLTFHLVIIVVFVVGCFLVLVRFNETVNPVSNKFTHSSLLEIVWTVIPAFLLVCIAVPSFVLLYAIDELLEPVLTLKVVGHQWYWSYEYSDYEDFSGSENLSFDSYMVPTSDLVKGSLRLLEVDNRVVLPIETHIRVLITAADVIHSWCVPSFGIKVDGCPGRLTQAALFIKREGVYYGQCSEICGVNHGFMPIVVKAVTVSRFTNWVALKLDPVFVA
jgi:cytochrome c oxidase subunit 2